MEETVQLEWVYVAGFAFSQDKQHVLLIEKAHPKWQAGHWNGLGGQIAEGETPEQAMGREFLEEAGIGSVEFEQFALLTGEAYQVHFMRSFVPFKLFARYANGYAGPTEEVVAIHEVNNLPDVIPNLRWLIPMALEKGLLITNPRYTVNEF